MQLKANNSYHLTWWGAGRHVEEQVPRKKDSNPSVLITLLFTFTHIRYIYIATFLYPCENP